jgi:hypothetical protein
MHSTSTEPHAQHARQSMHTRPVRAFRTPFHVALRDGKLVIVQQIRGRCSPVSMSTTRSPPKRVWSTTMAAGAAAWRRSSRDH